MSLIAPFIKEIFQGLKPSWKKIFLSSEFKLILNKCFKKLNADLIQKGVTAELIQENGIETYIRPVPSKILNAFKHFEMSETRVIIIGQDPYTKVDEAEGLSFSVPVGTHIPPSLQTIYQTLKSQKLITKIPNHGNLTTWARQGVLLLNRYLTRTPTIAIDDTGTAYVKNDGGSTKNNMHPFWTDFTNAVVKYISDQNPNIILLLWGKKAEEVCEAVAAKVAAEEIDIQVWGHPSPLNTSSNFGKCPHFKYVNEKLRELKLPEIDWNIQDVHLTKGIKKITPDAQVAIIEEIVHERIVVFTDGGCPKNGKKNAKAVYAAYFPKTFDGKPNGIVGEYSGVVPDKEINPDGKVFDGEKVTPTNNRGELLGIITAISVILQEYKIHKKKKSVLLVTDSEICMGTINAWIWKWMKSTKVEKKNMDLIVVLHKMLIELSETVPTDKLLQASAIDCKNNDVMDLDWGGLTVIHQNSHLAKKDIPKKGTREYELYAGNQRADDLCNAELEK